MKPLTIRLRPAFLLSVLAIAGASIFQVACGDDDSAVKDPVDSGTPVNPGDSGNNPPGDSGADSDATLLADADCFLNPTTHFEIINSCTDATRLTKNPTLSKLLPDGALPPIP